MIKDNITKSLNEQVNKELFSSYLYLAMSAHCDNIGFKGFANWFNVQAKEELAHAMHLYTFILDRSAAPELTSIATPKSSYTSMMEIFEDTLAHEQMITESINQISGLALTENDHATYQYLQWYVSEQVEEEANVCLILQKLGQMGDNPSLLYMMDAELITRVFVDPFAAGTATAV